MPGIPIHVVDVTRREPARGMTVSVQGLDTAGGSAGGSAGRVDGGTVGAGTVGAGTVGETGTVGDAALIRGDGLAAASFDLFPRAGECDRMLGLVGPAPPFQKTVVCRFALADPPEHVHLPIMLLPWGLSVWRGR
jgi:5-hydroxyisourate hydrolase